MAVGAYGQQAASRVYYIRRADFSQWPEVVDVDVAIHRGAIDPGKVKLADRTLCAVVLDALPARLATALIGIHLDLSERAFDQWRGGNLFSAGERLQMVNAVAQMQRIEDLRIEQAFQHGCQDAVADGILLGVLQ